MIRTFIISIFMLALFACTADEPGIDASQPKEMLDQVASDVESATQEAKDKIDEALE